MPKALVFINTRSDAAGIVRDLKKLSGVSEAHSSVGMYEAVAMVNGESFDHVREIVSKCIRSLENVESTLTLTLVESSAT